jgi:hypothetical protein
LGPSASHARSGSQSNSPDDQINPKRTSQNPRKIVRKDRDDTGKITTTPPATMLSMPVIAIHGGYRTSECPMARSDFKTAAMLRQLEASGLTVLTYASAAHRA